MASKISYFSKEISRNWLNQNKDDYYLTNADKKESQEFETVVELFNNERIEGKSIEELWFFLKDS